MNKEVIYLGADHAGFSLKEKIKKSLDKSKVKYKDIGAFSLNLNDDFPDYALKLAKQVSKNKNSRGILVCGTGTGMVIAANKIKGIRAAVGYDNYSVIMGRKDNNTNILCLRGRSFSDKKNLELVNLWLKSKFSNEARHKRRIDKIEKIN